MAELVSSCPHADQFALRYQRVQLDMDHGGGKGKNSSVAVKSERCHLSVADYLSSNMSDQNFGILEYKIKYIV